MIPLLWLAGAALIGGVVLAIYWEEIVDWLKDVWKKLPLTFKKNLLGAVAFVKRIGKTALNIIKYYAYNETTKEWTERKEEKLVDESTVPEEIRNRAKYRQGQEEDITKDIEQEIGGILTLNH